MTNHKIIIFAILIFQHILYIDLLIAQEVNQDFIAKDFSDSSGIELPYRLFIPIDYNQSSLYPIVVYLHGSGGNGINNLKQISGGNTNGTHVWTTPENQSKHPAFVLAPQLPELYYWFETFTRNLSPGAQTTLNLLRDLIKEFNIDPNRIYLTGQSAGGYGVWDILLKQPDLFAAAIPLCGGGNPFEVKPFLDVPIWVFHGALDKAVPVRFSREMVAVLNKSGGNVKYTEYPDVGHAVWESAYLEPELIDWLFIQKRE